MKILEAIDTLRYWFLKNNITIDPKKFRIRIEFDDMRDYAQFESAFRHDIHINQPEMYMVYSPFHSDRAEIMGVQIICTPPRHGCDCPTCCTLSEAGWRK